MINYLYSICGDHFNQCIEGKYLGEYNVVYSVEIINFQPIIIFPVEIYFFVVMRKLWCNLWWNLWCSLWGNLWCNIWGNCDRKFRASMEPFWNLKIGKYVEYQMHIISSEYTISCMLLSLISMAGRTFGLHNPLCKPGVRDLCDILHWRQPGACYISIACHPRPDFGSCTALSSSSKRCDWIIEICPFRGRELVSDSISTIGASNVRTMLTIIASLSCYCSYWGYGSFITILVYIYKHNAVAVPFDSKLLHIYIYIYILVLPINKCSICKQYSTFPQHVIGLRWYMNTSTRRISIMGKIQPFSQPYWPLNHSQSNT